MKKLLLLFTIGIIHSSYAQYTFVQYFDGADTSASNSVIINIANTPNNIWQIGKPQKPIFDSAATTPNVIVTDTVNYYPTNNTSVFSFHLTPAFSGPPSIYAVQWKQKLDMEKHKDGGILEYSLDSGLTWKNVFNNPQSYNFFGFDAQNKDTLTSGEYAFSGTDSIWKNVWFCLYLTPGSSPKGVSYKFTFKSDSVNNNKEGWMIDNFMTHVTFGHPISEHKESVNYTLYPNPAKETTTIELIKIGETQQFIEAVQLIDMEGKMINEWKNTPTKFTIDLSKYASGLYFVKATSNGIVEKIPLAIMRK